MRVLEIVERMLMLGIHPDWINAIYHKGVEDGRHDFRQSTQGNARGT